MLVHFIGDIGQPLHCENLEVGGNNIDVEFDGEDTNLHSVWDTEIPETVSKGSSMTSAKSWAATLTTCKSSPLPSSPASLRYVLPLPL